MDLIFNQITKHSRSNRSNNIATPRESDNEKHQNPNLAGTRFTRERNMPFVSVILSRGFYCFPTEQSYERYLANSRKFDNLDGDGLGVPLFQVLDFSAIQILADKKLPDYRFYKYVLRKSGDPPPYQQHELISTDGNKRLYKLLFCEAFRSRLGLTKLEYRFTLYTDEGIFTTVMIRCTQTRSIDTHFGGCNLRWKTSEPFLSPIFSRNFKLQILDDNMPSLLDDDDTRRRKNGPVRKSSQLPLWARYFADTATVIPKKRTQKLANLVIGETEEETNPASYGLGYIPWATQVLACTCMVLHHLEDERRQRKRRSNG